jgi:hypothetical protein
MSIFSLHLQIILGFTLGLYISTRAIVLNYKTLGSLIILCLLLVIPLWLCISLEKTFIYPLLVFCILTLQILFLIVSCVFFIFRKKTILIDKVISFIGSMYFIYTGILCFVILVPFFKDNEDKVLYKEKIYANYYLRYECKCDCQLHIPSISLEENPLFITRTYRIDADLFNDYPEKIKYISLKDSLLRFALIKNNIEKEYALDLRFEYIDPPHEGLRVVSFKKKKGAIDSTGKIIIPLVHDELDGCHNGLLHAQKHTKFGYRTGYIDRTGKIVIPFKFDGGGNFLSDSTTVVLRGTHYWINKKGEILSK